jgi:hypothetical protein
VEDLALINVGGDVVVYGLRSHHPRHLNLVAMAQGTDAQPTP